ncbi:MAG TPA: alanine racemase [Clostridiales bacterium UBA8153]|nr:alanine racemase [Clostridiales bacterium UBA8153]
MVLRTKPLTKFEVNLDHLVENYHAVQRHVAPSEVVAVVKSEAYGHGALATSRALRRVGCRQFAVATVEEGIQLRRAGLDAGIMLIGPALPKQYPVLAEYRLVPLISEVAGMEELSRLALRLGRRLPYHIEVDVGLGRMGFLPGQGPVAAAAALRLAPTIQLEGVGSHLSAATASEEHNRLEYGRFVEFVSAFPAGVRRHLAASSAAARFPHMHLEQVRVGGLLYGIKHVTGGPEVTQVLSLKTTVALVKVLPPGWHIGYNFRHRVERETTVAVLSMGWSDGLMIAGVAKAGVLIRGAWCRLLGLCTDFAMVDTTGGPEVQVGDEVVVMGTQDSHTITPMELAQQCGVSTGELLGKIALRVPRLYLQGGECRDELSILCPGTLV